LTVLRDRRILILGAAVLAAAAVVVVLIVVAGGGDSSSTTTNAAGTAAKGGTTALLAGIPQHGTSLGRATAPVTLIEFADPQCPYCAQWSRDAFPAVVRDYVRPGKVRLEFRGAHFIGPDSDKALRAQLAAGLQNKLWNMVEGMYQNQGAENSGWVTDDLMRKVANDIPGLDADRMLEDASSAKVKTLLRQSDNLALQLQVAGTPSFYILQPPSKPRELQVTSLDAAGFTATLSDALSS
jgi:protein-disulfide isomerase